MSDDRPVTRREIDQRFSGHDHVHVVEGRARDEALAKADVTLQARLRKLNEWRAQIADERTTYATKADIKSVIDGCKADVAAARQASQNDVTLLREQVWKLMGLSVAIGGAIGGALVQLLRGT